MLHDNILSSRLFTKRNAENARMSLLLEAYRFNGSNVYDSVGSHIRNPSLFGKALEHSQFTTEAMKQHNHLLIVRDTIYQ